MSVETSPSITARRGSLCSMFWNPFRAIALGGGKGAPAVMRDTSSSREISALEGERRGRRRQRGPSCATGGGDKHSRRDEKRSGQSVDREVEVYNLPLFHPGSGCSSPAVVAYAGVAVGWHKSSHLSGAPGDESVNVRPRLRANINIGCFSSAELSGRNGGVRPLLWRTLLFGKRQCARRAKLQQLHRKNQGCC